MTVGLVILFLKRAFVQLLQTERTDKVLWMKLAVHRCYAAASYWFMTTGTQRAALSVIVGLAVGLAFVIKEAATIEGRTTVLWWRLKIFLAFNLFQSIY